MLAIVYHVHIWQVLPQLSCGDTCQIWMWCKQSNRYFDRIKTFAYGEINERSFSNPHPWAVLINSLWNVPWWLLSKEALCHIRGSEICDAIWRTLLYPSSVFMLWLLLTLSLISISYTFTYKLGSLFYLVQINLLPDGQSDHGIHAAFTWRVIALFTFQAIYFDDMQVVI